MLIVVVVLIGAVLVVGLVLSAARRRDMDQAIGVLSRETRRQDHSDDALRPLADQAGVMTGREVERRAAAQRAGRETGTGPRVGTGLAQSPYSAPDMWASAPPAPAPPAPADPEALGVTRRQFLNRAILGTLGLSVAGLGTAVVGFLWPTLKAGGFGAKIHVGSVSDINATIATRQPFYSPEARAYMNPYPVIDVPKAKKSGAYADPILAGMQLGYVALYQKCPHLGCRVPWCQSSQWFECPCHGSQYNRVGEKKGGPAPRGMDRFAFSISGGAVTIDTSTVYLGPPIGTNTTGQEAEGPHCR